MDGKIGNLPLVIDRRIQSTGLKQLFPSCGSRATFGLQELNYGKVKSLTSKITFMRTGFKFVSNYFLFKI